MKNFILLITCSLTILSCKVKKVEETTTNTLAVQEDRPAADSALFDIKTFNINKGKDGGSPSHYTFTLKDGREITQSTSKPERYSPDSLRDYQEEVSKQWSPFVIRKKYNYEGKLMRWSITFRSESINKAYEYDENGKIVKITDSEENFKHSFADIREFLLEKKKIDIYDTRQAIARRVDHSCDNPKNVYYHIQVLDKDYDEIDYVIIINDITLEMKEYR